MEFIFTCLKEASCADQSHHTRNFLSLYETDKKYGLFKRINRYALQLVHLWKMLVFFAIITPKMKKIGSVFYSFCFDCGKNRMVYTKKSIINLPKINKKVPVLVNKWGIPSWKPSFIWSIIQQNKSSISIRGRPKTLWLLAFGVKNSYVFFSSACFLAAI